LTSFFRPGKLLAFDCEIMGVGIEGAESSLARVSMVNFYGAVIMDELAMQEEPVESDIIHGMVCQIPDL
jgi:RNA exonuclease 4